MFLTTIEKSFGEVNVKVDVLPKAYEGNESIKATRNRALSGLIVKAKHNMKKPINQSRSVKFSDAASQEIGLHDHGVYSGFKQALAFKIFPTKTVLTVYIHADWNRRLLEPPVGFNNITLSDYHAQF